MSVQAAMNQMLGTAGQLAIQTRAPYKFAEAQSKEIAAREQKEIEALDIATKFAEEEAKKTEAGLPKDAPAEITKEGTDLTKGRLSGEAKSEAKEYSDMAKAYESHAKTASQLDKAYKDRMDFLYKKFQREPNPENYEAYLKAKNKYEDPKREREEDWRKYSQSASELSRARRKEQAEAEALERMLGDINTYINQRQALNERELMLKKLAESDTYWTARKGGNQ